MKTQLSQTTSSKRLKNANLLRKNANGGSDSERRILSQQPLSQLAHDCIQEVASL